MAAFFSFVTDHWPFAILMFTMSIAGATLLVWRILLNVNASTNLDVFLPRLHDTLRHDGLERASDLCRIESGLIPKFVLAAGLDTWQKGSSAARKAMAHAIELEVVPSLNTLLPSILAIAKISTMVGLLGTVISMIGTFQVLGEANAAGGDKQAAQARASGEIGLALFATALGLVTAIPLVFAHTLLKANAHKFEIKAKHSAQKLLEQLQETKQQSLDGAPQRAAPPAARAPELRPRR
jgi:biopolymer transport protein ExbB